MRYVLGRSYTANILILALSLCTQACLKAGDLKWSSSSSNSTNVSGGGTLGTPTILINGGATYTNNTVSTLTLGAPGYTDMYITNTPGCTSGGSWQAFSASTVWMLTANASNTVYVKYQDSLLNQSSCVGTSIIHDSIVPSITMTTPTPGTYINVSTNSATYTVTGTCNDASAIVTILVDGSSTGLSQSGSSCNGATFNVTVSTIGISEGAHTFSASITDLASNTSTTGSVAITKDSIAPSVGITTPAGSSYINSSNNSASFVVSGTCSDSSALVSVLIDATTQASGIPCSAGSFSTTVNTTGLTQGLHNFTASIVDPAGNSFTTGNVAVTKDTVIPAVSITSPSPGYINSSANSSSYTVSGTCNDATANVTILMDGSSAGLSQTGGACNGTTFTAQISTLGLSEAAHTLSGTISDAAGNTSASGNVAMSKDITPPSWASPSLSHAATTTSLNSSPSINYSPSATDTFSGIGASSYEYAIGTATSGVNQTNITSWTVIAGTPFSTGSLSLDNINTYYVSMRVKDNAGNYTTPVVSSGWIVQLVVLATYPASGSNWNDYVINNGVDIFSATGAACTGSESGYYNACLHGGEMRKVVINGASSCAGLTLTDSLGAFNWTCMTPGGIATFFSVSLKSNKGLKDLLLTSGTGWNSNSVSLTGTYTNTSQSSAWYTNPVSILPLNNGASAMITLATAGNIYTTISNQLSNGYNINADKIGIVTLNGSVLSYGGNIAFNCDTTTGESGSTGRCLLSAGNQKFLWIEGEFSGFNASNSAQFNLMFGGFTAPTGVQFSRVHQFKSSKGQGDEIQLVNSQKNLFDQINISNNTYDGLWLDVGSGNNIFNQLQSYNNGGTGITILSSSGNKFTDIHLTNNSLSGVAIDGSSGGVSNQIFDQVVTFNNGGDGIELNGASVNNNTFKQVVSTNNGGFGISSSLSTDNYLVQVTTAYNFNSNVYISGGSGNTFHQMVSYYSGFEGIYINSSTQNTFGQLINSDNQGTYGTRLFASVSSSNKFTGNYLLNGACGVSGPITGISAVCAANGSSTATVISGSSIFSVGSFVGAVGSDTSNTSDTGGLASHPGSGAFDWWQFDNFFRTWGLASSPFVDQWISGSGRIWDWQVRVGDTLFLNKSGNGSTSNGAFTNGAACPGEVNGTNTSTNMQGTPKTYLNNAVELVNDSARNPSGNNNGLCESNEGCLYTPNFGAYQGHGSLGTCTFSNGAVSNVTMYGYTSNGI